MTKICYTCKRYKPSKYFSKEKQHKDGLNSSCKECMKNYNTKRVAKLLLNAARHRAKKKGLSFDLQLRDIIIPRFCPILGIALSPGNGKRHDASPTIDRIDSQGGYTKDNISIISWRANHIKNDGTLQEILAIANWMQLQVPSEVPCNPQCNADYQI